MLAKKTDPSQLGFYGTFEEQLDRKHPLYILAGKLNWQLFEDSFSKLYCAGNGRPAKPIRRMVALLVIKHVRNLSDESAVGQWAENAYYQYLSGERAFACGAPCEASELVHFRNRIGEEGVELIFRESIRINGGDAGGGEATVDTTVQEKNITYPTDNKLHRRIIAKCRAIADKGGLELRQSYTRTLKKLGMEQRFRNHPRNKGRARKADRKVRTIAGRLVRELERKLPAGGRHEDALALFKKVLAQKRGDRDKVYSLHEPHVQCIAKGKEHKKYEFGSKASVLVTRDTGVIIGAINIPVNTHDSKTLEPALEQQQRLTGRTLEKVYADRGYRGVREVLGTKVETPSAPKASDTAHQKKKKRHGFRRRAAIEPRIGHLKSDHRLGRNFYGGIKGDNINVMLAAAAMNIKRMMNKWSEGLFALILRLLAARLLLLRQLMVSLNPLARPDSKAQWAA